MTNEEKKEILKLYKAPFTYDPHGGGYIWDAHGEMVADKAGGDPDLHILRIHDLDILRIRGWGRLSQLTTEPHERQDKIGELIAQALTEFWQRNT